MILKHWMKRHLAKAVIDWRNHAKMQKKFGLLGLKIIKRWTQQVIRLASECANHCPLVG